MILSSESNFFRTSTGDMICEDISLGKPLVIVMECGKIVVTLSHLSREYLPNPATPLHFNENNDSILRFSDKIYVSHLPSKVSIDKLKYALGENVDVIKTYEIITMQIQENLKRRIEKRHGKKDGFLYFKLRCCNHFNDSDKLANGHVFIITHRPSPLLSLCLSCKFIDNSKDSHNESVSLNPLLQQCVKRLLNGNIILFNQKLDDFKSIISLTLPSTTKELIFEISGAVASFKTKISSREEVSSSVYLILPSTRITIDYEESPDKAPENPTKIATNMDNLVLRVIEGIRYFSLLNVDGTDHHADIPRALLLLGPPGVGKTYQVKTAIDIVNSDSQSDRTKLISIRGSEILSLSPNEADVALYMKKLFSNAVTFTDSHRHNISIIFMDECDALLSSDVIGATLGSLLDRLSNCYEHGSPGWKRILVVAATNRVDAIPAYLRRPGRFDQEIYLSPPSEKKRLQILKSLVAEMGVRLDNFRSTLSQDDLIRIAEITVGYVAADLSSLLRRALFLGIADNRNPMHTLSIHHLQKAMKDVGASALRHTSASAPPATTWDDISGDPGGAKTALRRAVEWPINKRDDFKRLGLAPPRGILLHGPPGCAKTTLARAAAGSAGVAFISLSPAEVYSSSYVGEAEGVIRRVFSLARSASPCILFFDEIDAIVSSSGKNNSRMDRGSNAEARVLSTFLNEMDGVDGSISDGVLVLAATNRPSTLDAALLRPGRFDCVIYVPNPDAEARRQIFAEYHKEWVKCIPKGMSDDIDLDLLASDRISGLMTGAEVVGACREAAMLAIREMLDSGGNDIPVVKHKHLEAALRVSKPLLSNSEILDEYTRFEKEHFL